MPVPAAARLVEFSLVRNPDPPPRSGGIPVFTRPLQTPIEPVIDREAERVAAAFLRGRNEGLDTARAEFEAKLAEAEASFEERLVAERSLWVSEQGSAVAEQIDRAFEKLSADVGDAVGGILAPFVEDTLRARIVEELLRTLEKVLKGGRPATLKITGPEDIIDAIRRTLGDTATAIDFETTSDVDARIVADSTVIETQLEAWRRRIRGE